MPILILSDLVNGDINNVRLNDDNFDDDDPELIIHDRLIAWYSRYNKHKVWKKK